jgi:hypothetical protein
MEEKMRLLIAMIVSALVVSCAPQKDVAPGSTGETGTYEFEKEGEAKTVSGEGTAEETDFEEIPLAEEDVVGEEVEAPQDTASAGPVAPGTKAGSTGMPVSAVAGKEGGSVVPVFRVQILAVSDEVSAQDAKQTAALRLKHPVYVELVDGMYKVRVGDCATRLEAEKLLRKCRESGYPDAWIVTGALKVGVDGKKQ